MKYSFLALFAVLSLSSSSCNDKKKEVETEEKIEAAKPTNEAEILQYIADNKLDAKKTDSGLYYVIQEEGTGKQPTADSEVTVAYKGSFTNKQVFDQSDAKGVSFPLQNVVKGWTEGIPLFKEGGKGILLIPSELGYGSNNMGPIPGGSVLIFDIHLIEVK